MSWLLAVIDTPWVRITRDPCCVPPYDPWHDPMFYVALVLGAALLFSFLKRG